MTVSEQDVQPGRPAHESVEVNGVELHYAHAGDGPMILFPHGFPEMVAREVGELVAELIPALVMYPTADRWIRPASHAGLERYVPDLAFIEVDGATHWLPEERPELVSQAIREHLARVAGRHR